MKNLPTKLIFLFLAIAVIAVFWFFSQKTDLSQELERKPQKQQPQIAQNENEAARQKEKQQQEKQQKETSPTKTLREQARDLKIALTPEGEIDTSNWQTYRNEELGFTVKYIGKYYTLGGKIDKDADYFRWDSNDPDKPDKKVIFCNEEQCPGGMGGITVFVINTCSVGFCEYINKRKVSQEFDEVTAIYPNGTEAKVILAYDANGKRRVIEAIFCTVDRCYIVSSDVDITNRSFSDGFFSTFSLIDTPSKNLSK